MASQAVKYPYRAEVGREVVVNSTDPRALRAGSWRGSRDQGWRRELAVKQILDDSNRMPNNGLRPSAGTGRDFALNFGEIAVRNEKCWFSAHRISADRSTTVTRHWRQYLIYLTETHNGHSNVLRS
jgi:hypothetical protein